MRITFILANQLLEFCMSGAAIKDLRNTMPHENSAWWSFESFHFSGKQKVRSSVCPPAPQSRRQHVENMTDIVGPHVHPLSAPAALAGIVIDEMSRTYRIPFLFRPPFSAKPSPLQSFAHLRSAHMIQITKAPTRHTATTAIASGQLTLSPVRRRN